MNIVLFGPPGSGKGTPADNLAKEFNLFKISTGDLLRTEVKKESSLGKQIKSVIDKGLLVSDNIINNLIENIISNKNYFNRLIFDGYPRNLQQAKNLEILVKKYNQKIFCFLSLNVDKDIIIKRILGRQVCSKCDQTFNEYFNPSTEKNHKCGPDFLKKRSDDNEKIIKKRFSTYEEETFPVLEYYSKKNLLHQIEGMREISQIYKEIRDIIASLDT